jgi:DNA-binding response OmpR family regulator
VRILIAEDDQTSRQVLQRTLEKLGYGVLAEKDGLDAWGQFEAQRPAIVITDWMMPRMDGLTLCRRIRADARHDRYTWLVVLTALSGKKNYLEAMNAGADDFLTKPFDPDELVSRLRVAERILRMEAALRYYSTLHGACPECNRMRDESGQWTQVRQLAERASAKGPAPRCPECQRKQASPRALTGAGVTTQS